MGNAAKWTKVVATVESEDTGDILLPLKRVAHQYAQKALAWENRAPKVDARPARDGRSRRPLPVSKVSLAYLTTNSQIVDNLCGDRLALGGANG